MPLICISTCVFSVLHHSKMGTIRLRGELYPTFFQYRQSYQAFQCSSYIFLILSILNEKYILKDWVFYYRRLDMFNICGLWFFFFFLLLSSLLNNFAQSPLLNHLSLNFLRYFRLLSLTGLHL